MEKDKILKDKSDVKMDISNEPELDPLEAIDKALQTRIRITTSSIQTIRNDPGSTEFVCIEGTANDRAIQYLKQSISDLVKFPDTISSEVSSIHEDSSNVISKASSKTGESFFSIQSCTSSFDGIVDTEALRKAEEAITALESQGPAGIVQMSCLTAAIQRPIRIWLPGKEEIRKVGKTRTGETVDVEYHEPAVGEEVGHYTLPGNKDPNDVQGQLNDCLFSVIGDQTGQLAPEIRESTIAEMKKKVKSLAKRIEDIAMREKCDRISLMIGGARYVGNTPQDAGKVIDNSQQGRCYPQGYQGHPRGHASYPQGAGPTDSAEAYSNSGMKSAFLSREDQDAAGHLALRTQQAQRAMESLNAGQTNVAIHVRPEEMQSGSLPKGVEFYQGLRQGGERPFRDLVLVLRHHEGQQNNPDADVFVHTFYPRLQ